jgi:hypothetical protein
MPEGIKEIHEIHGKAKVIIKSDKTIEADELIWISEDEDSGKSKKYIISTDDGKHKDILVAKMHMNKMHELKEVKELNKAFLGVIIEDGDKGVRVIGFSEPSAARESGIEVGDQIFKVGKVKVSDMESLIDALKDYEPGDKAKIRYYRGDKKGKVKAMLKERPVMEEMGMLHEIDMDQDFHFDFLPKLPDCEENGTGKKIIILDDEEGNQGIRVIVKIEDEEVDVEEEIEVIVEMEEEIEIEEALEIEMEAEIEEEVEIRMDGNTLDLGSFKAFPNPTSGNVRLTFTSPEKGDLTIQIIDMGGNIVLKEVRRNFEGSFDQSFDLSSAAKGNVSINVLQNGRLFTETVVVH